MTAQAMDALRVANDVRSRAAEVRREIKGLPHRQSVMFVAELIESTDERIASIPTGRLLSTVPLLGETKTFELLRAAGVMSWDRRIRDLTERQRLALVWELRTWRLWPASRWSKR